jgi:hypothetical protein
MAYLYHITHYSNIPKIIDAGGLMAKNVLSNHCSDYVNIAHASIQDTRASTQVPLAPGGTLHDYVPFYFCYRSPMLYAIYNGKVAGYDSGQDHVVYFVTDTDCLCKSGARYVFTDGHAIMFYSQYFNNIKDLSKLNWNYIQSRYWFDNEDYPDRKRQKQAEFLVYEKVDWNVIQCIVTINNEIKEKISNSIATCTHKPEILIKKDWYY